MHPVLVNRGSGPHCCCMHDTLTRYYFPKLGIRAALVNLKQAQAQLIARNQGLPAPVQRWLREFSAANALMLSGIKLDGRIVLQLQAPGTSPGALKLLFTDCTHQGHLRGIGRMAPSTEQSSQDQPDFSADTSFASATLGGYLAITIEPNVGFGERSQGVVPLDPDGVAATLTHYFEQSEQLPTQFFLASDADGAAGLMVQSVAAAGGLSADIPELDVDGWSRICQLASTVKPEELLKLPAEELMFRLFSGEEVRDLGSHSIRFHCSCSRERVQGVLMSIGRDEALMAAQDAGFAQIDCEFCGADYRFDRVEIDALFHAERLQQPISAVLQ
jgi:molecular chaperone Hsp33